MVATSPVSKKPSVVEDVAALALEVLADHERRRCTFSRPKVVPSCGRRLAVIVGQLQLDAGRRAALLQLVLQLLLRRHRRHLGGRAWRGCRAARSRSCPRRASPRRRSRRGRRASAPPAPPSRRSPPASASAGLPPVARRCCSSICQTVGTAAEKVTPSVSISSWIDAPSSFWPGITSLQPTAGQEKARPQALAWNIGTTGSTTSRLERPITSCCSVTSVCRKLERCE